MSYFKKNYLMSNSGHFTVEILVAFAVCSLCLAGVAALTFGNQSVSVDTERNAKALQIAKADLESVIANSRTDFESVAALAKQLCPADTSFECERTVATGIDGNSKKVTTVVSWLTDQRSQNVSLANLAVNTQEIEAVGGPDGGGNRLPANTLNNPPDTSTPGSGIWNNGTTPCPVVESINSLDTAVSIGLGSKASGLDVVNGYAYVTAITGANQPDFIVINISNITSPAITKSIKTGSGGLNAVDVVGNYAYAASVNGNGQLQIINIVSNAVTSFNLPSNSMPALDIFYHDHKVYVGTDENSSGPELYEIDVTNPTSPSILNSYEIGAGVNKIFVRGSKVYVASKGAGKDLVIVDLPSNTLSLFDNPGSNGAQSVYYLNSNAFMGAAPNFSVVNVSGSPTLTSNTAFTGTINDIAVLATTAFLGTSNSSRYFQMWDVSDLPNPKICSSSSGVYSLTAPVVGVIVQGNYAYIALKDEYGPLRIIKFK